MKQSDCIYMIVCEYLRKANFQPLPNQQWKELIYYPFNRLPKDLRDSLVAKILSGECPYEGEMRLAAVSRYSSQILSQRLNSDERMFGPLPPKLAQSSDPFQITLEIYKLVKKWGGLGTKDGISAVKVLLSYLDEQLRK